MKYIFTFLIALTVMFGFSQSLPIDFDDTKDNNFVGVDGSVFSVILDGTDNVGKIIGGQNQWNSNVGLTLDTWIDMTTTNKTITFDFYTSEAVIMNGLLQLSTEKSGGYAIEVRFSTDGAVGWETITLDFNTADNGYPNCQTCPDPKPVVFGEYAKISLFTNFGDTGTSTYWFDDIAGAANGGTVETCSDGVMNNGETAIDCGGPNCSPCVTPPATAAPTPPARAAADVISLYSDAYTDVASNFDANWCGPNSVEEISVAGNATTAFLGNTCQGIVLNTAVDASTFTNYHVDIFIEAGTDLDGKTFHLKFVGTPTSVVKEVNHDLNALQPNVGEWVSFDGTVDLSTMGGFKEFGVTTNLANGVYYDNLYAYKGTPLSLGETDNGISIYPNPFTNHIEISAAEAVNQVRVFNITGQEVLRAAPHAATFRLDTSNLKKGVYLLSLESNGKSTTAKMVK